MRFFPSTLVLMTILLTMNAAQAQQQWGNIKGQVVFDGDKIPARKIMVVNKDAPACLAVKKQLLSEEWVIDPKTKGVKWVVVWLIPENVKFKEDMVKPIPIHPDLQKKQLENVVIDQPCCMFEPPLIALQKGQSITVKNSMTIAHNAKVDGSEQYGNRAVNSTIPPGGKTEIGPFSPQWNAIPITCGSHGWMSAEIRVFSHPYFFVTGENGEFAIANAPAGKYRLVMNHLGSGWVTGEKEPNKFGMVIDIKPNQTTDLGKFKIAAPKPEK